MWDGCRLRVADLDDELVKARAVDGVDAPELARALACTACLNKPSEEVSTPRGGVGSEALDARILPIVTGVTGTRRVAWKD